MTIIGRLLVPYALKLACLFAIIAIIAPIAAILLGARQAGRNAERVERKRRTIEVQR